MKKTVAFFAGLITLLISHIGIGQPKAQEGKSLLWSISGKDLKKTSYLFGTIHMICRDDYVWTKKMNESLDKSEKVCFEMDLDDPTVMLQVAGGLSDNSGKKLHDYFTPDEYASLKKYIKDSLSLDIALFEHMKPIALQTLLSTGSLNCGNSVSYEDSIMKIAQKSNKEILGLEQPTEQLSALETIPTDSVIKQLLDELKYNNKDDSEYNMLIAAYKNQDLPELFRLITSSKELGDELDAFLDDRNKKWISRMTDKMNRSSVFFAVGAGHLWGQNGVIQLMRNAGYTITQVN